MKRPGKAPSKVPGLREVGTTIRRRINQYLVNNLEGATV